MTTIASRITGVIERMTNATLGSCERRLEMKYLALAALLAFLMAPMAVGCKSEPLPPEETTEEAAPAVEEAPAEEAPAEEAPAEEAPAE